MYQRYQKNCQRCRHGIMLPVRVGEIKSSGNGDLLKFGRSVTIKCDSCRMTCEETLETGDRSDLEGIILHSLSGPGVEINSW